MYPVKAGAKIAEKHTRQNIQTFSSLEVRTDKVQSSFEVSAIALEGYFEVKKTQPYYKDKTIAFSQR